MVNSANQRSMSNHENAVKPHTAMDIEQLYQLYFKDVYQFCFYFTNKQSEAEDLTQETFIKAMKALDKFEGKSSWQTWLLAIARHTAIDSFRRKKWLLLSSFSMLSQEKTEIDQEAKRFEDLEEIGQALQKIKPHLRATVILRGLKDLSIRETASILACSEEKVRVDYHRALKELRVLLTEEKIGGEVK